MNLKLLSTAVLGLISATAAQDADTETPTDTNATVITDNQPLSFHHASLLKKDNTTVYGDITITTRDHSSALQVDVRIGGIPEGEYLNYHIHASRVPEDGNCYLTGSHLDPHGRGQEPPCTITAPQTCEVGDLSGKHGPAWAPEGQEFHATYTDFFLANTPGHEAYFGDLSWVVHAPNSDRLTCGNFEGFSGAGFGGWDLGRDGKA